jgi:hypothetical protein
MQFHFGECQSMFCKWCGLDSSSTDVCEWCGKSFSTAAPSPEPREDDVKKEDTQQAGKDSSYSDESVDEDIPLIGLRHGAGGVSRRESSTEAHEQAEKPSDSSTIHSEASGMSLSATDISAPVHEPLNRARPPEHTEEEKSTAKASTAPPIIPLMKRPGSRQVMPPVTPLKAKNMNEKPAAVIPLVSPQSHPSPVNTSRQSSSAEQTNGSSPPVEEEDFPTIGGKPASAASPAPSLSQDSPAIGSGAPANTVSGWLPGQHPKDRVEVPKAGGLTWYCKWCGMQSSSPDVCSWCHQDLKGEKAVPTIGVKGVASGGTSPRLKIVETKPERAKASKESQVVLVDDVVRERRDLALQIVEYLGWTLLMTTLAIMLTHKYHGMYLIAMGIANFASCIMMPLIGVAPFGEDDSEDLALAGGFYLILGPPVGGIVYSVIGAIKQGVNPALVGIFITYVLIRLNMDHFAAKNLRDMLPMQGGIMGFFTHLIFLAGMAGWYAAGIFHKPNE